MSSAAARIADKRSPRRQRLTEHLYRCGPRPVLEALLAVEAGRPLEEVLAEYDRLPVSVFWQMGAARLEPVSLDVIEGGRQ